MLLRRKRQQPPAPAPGDPSLVLEHLEAGIWDWDIVTGAVFLAPGWKRQIGFQDDELPTSFSTFEKQLHPDDRDRVRKQREAARDSGDDFYLTEFRLRHRDGSYRWIFCRARIVRDEGGRALRMVGVDTDISERKRIEEALAGSEDRMRRTQQITKTAHWSWFPDRPGGDWRGGRILFETAADLFGVDAIVHLNNSRYLEEFVHPDDRALVAKMFATSMGGRERRYEIEYRVIVGEREIKTIHEVAEVFRDKGGRVVNAQGTIQDITDRKRMQEALSTSERRMRRAQHMAKIAHWVRRIEDPDTSGRGSYEYSETASSIFGVSLAELNSCPKGYVETFVHPADREKAKRAFENVGTKEGPAYALEYRIICPDGKVKTVHEVAENGFDPTDGVLTTSGIVQDITERKEMEEALTQSEGRMRRAQQIARLGHWVIDAEIDGVEWGATIAKWSENAAAIYGITPDELAISNDEYIQRFVHPADRKLLREAYLAAESAESGAGRRYRLEYRIIRSDGDVRTIYETAEPSHDAHPGRIIWNGVIQDITERKRMEEALSISEGRMRRAQHMARMCHWVSETKLGASKGGAEVAHYSASATELFGFEPDQLTLPDQEFIRRYIYPADQERVAAQYIEMHDPTGGAPADFQIEFRMVMPDGSIKFVNEIAEPSLEAKPGWIVWQGVIQDITERKQMEEALYLSESRMRRAQRIARLGHWITLRPNNEPSWRRAVSEYSEIAAEIFGVPPEELAISNEQYIQRFVHPADREMVAAAFEASSDNDGGFRLEYRIVTPSGEVRTVYETAEAAHGIDQNRLIRHGIVQDITERKHAEEALAQGEKLYRSIVESAFDAFVLIDSDDRIIDWNPSAERLFGLQRTEALGRLAETIFPPDQRQRYLRGITDYLETGRSDFLGSRNEVTAMRHDGASFPSELVIWPIAVSQRVIFSCFIHDLSTQRAMEARLRHVMRMEAVGQLTGGVAHDFNNLLAVILLNSETLSERLEADPKSRHLAEVIGRAADSGKVLVEQLSAFARRQLLRPQSVQLQHLIPDLMPLLTRSLNESIESDTDIAADAWPAHVDPNQFENALINLAVNARDAMPHGGTLTFRVRNVEISEDDAKLQPSIDPGRYVLISVIDTGVGMKPEVAERAYEPFFTTKEVGKGSGLGLSSVYGFISQSGGQVKIDTEVDKGTTVHLYLPAAEIESVAEGKPVELKPVEGGNEAILVVEDDDLIRDVIESQLQGLGYKVYTASDGPSAIKVLESDASIDLLLTDIVMPGGMSGIVVAERARHLRPGIKTLYASGYPASAFTAAWSDPTRVRILPKPFRTVQLARAVRAALDE